MADNQKRILVVTQYIYPENFKSNELFFEMVKRGYHVDVPTGIPNYPEGVYCHIEEIVVKKYYIVRIVSRQHIHS